VWLLVLFVPFGVEREYPGIDADLQVLIRVDARQFGTDDVGVVLGVFLDAERWAAREWQQGGPWRLQPIEELRETGG
jgi:hypothetical protein